MPFGCGRIFITPPSIADSWISNLPAEAVEPPISRSDSVPVLISFMKPPATSEPFGVARDHGCLISIEPALYSWADAGPMTRMKAAARRIDFIVLLQIRRALRAGLRDPGWNPGARKNGLNGGEPGGGRPGGRVFVGSRNPRRPPVARRDPRRDRLWHHDADC